MSLDALKVALQGLYPLSPIALAVQGLIEELTQATQPPTGYAKSHVNYKKYEDPQFDEYIRKLNEHNARKLQVNKEDELAVEFILALLQTEIMYG
jgi:hypothetical protein